MPSKPIIEQLPEEVREWLEKELVSRNFSGYLELTKVLNEHLASRGLELQVGRTALWSWGSAFEQRLAMIKQTAQQAAFMARELRDDEAATADAALRVLQSKVFEFALHENLDARTVNALSHAAADLARAGVVQKKHMAQVRARSEAVAKQVEKQARAGGLSEQTVEDIKKKILGIVDAA